MSDLVKRLRTANGWELVTIVHEGADRIDHLERVLAQAREAMKVAVSANNFRAACLCSDAPMEKIDFAETAFWRAMDNLGAIAAIDEALGKEKPSE